MSLRGLRVLVQGLPPDSAAARAELGHMWTRDDTWLLREVANATRKLLVLTANINREKGRSPIPMPEDLPTPDSPDDEDGNGQGDDEELAALRTDMNAMRARMFTHK